MKSVVYIMIVILVAGLALTATPEEGETENSLTCESQTELTLQGENFDSNISLIDTRCKTGADEEGVNFTDTEEDTIEVTGIIQTPTPCYTVSYGVHEDNGHYEVDVYTVPDHTEYCITCIGAVEYKLYLEAEDLQDLEISHNGEPVGSASP